MASIPHEQKGPPGEHPPHPADAAGHGHHGDHPPFLHHHFETPLQQFESDKFGMWLFLATEILLFGGLFCAYAIYRANHPEVFHFAHKFLDWKLGGLNTLILIFSSFTMAWGVRAAQLGQTKLLAIMLAITIACGGGFMVIKYFEYSHKIHEGLTWGGTYSYDPEHGHGQGHDAQPAAIGDAEDHEVAEPPPLAESDDRHVTPHPIVDPVQGTTGEPPRFSEVEAETAVPGVSPEAAESGAEAAAEQHAVVPESTERPDPAAIPEAHLEAAEALAPVAQATGVPTTHSTVAAPGTLPAMVPARETPAALGIEPSRVPPAAQPPAGLAGPQVTVGIHAEDAPHNARIFFSIYFAMTGLHGIHVLIGMIVLGIMLALTLKGRFTADYWTPIDLTGLYWHIVDLIWIFLFPLLYLIS